MRWIAVWALLAALPAFGAELTPATSQAFDRYTALAEKQLQDGPFLYADAHPEAQTAARRGETFVLEQKAAERALPGGLVHDWLGVTFFPGVTVDQMRALMQDYEHYKSVYAPDVIDSHLIASNGKEFKAYLKLQNTEFMKLIYDSEYAVEYRWPAASEMEAVSHSTRMAQEGGDVGFLWRVNTYWRFREADGGVYVECRAISLSRGLPLGFGWLRGFLERFPRESMTRTMDEMRRAATCRGVNCGQR